jgi:hypothetical protein
MQNVSFALAGLALAGLLGLTAGCSSTAPKAAPVAPPTAPPAAPVASAAPEAPADELKNTIRWATASEINNFGYDVYRGDTEEGPFVRLTPSPILGAGTTDETQRYEFVDKNIEPGRDYFYYVESISIDGERERFTPVSKVPAKGARKSG